MNRNKQPHGRPGHLNLCTPDERSAVTGFGRHARVVAFHPVGARDRLYCRVDRPGLVVKFGDSQYPDLPDPTPAQVLAAARRHYLVRGRWKLRSVVEWNDGLSLEYQFDPA